MDTQGATKDETKQVEISADLHRQAKAAAALRGVTLRAWMDEAACEKMAREEA